MYWPTQRLRPAGARRRVYVCVRGQLKRVFARHAAAFVIASTQSVQQPCCRRRRHRRHRRASSAAVVRHTHTHIYKHTYTHPIERIPSSPKQNARACSSAAHATRVIFCWQLFVSIPRARPRTRSRFAQILSAALEIDRSAAIVARAIDRSIDRSVALTHHINKCAARRTTRARSAPLERHANIHAHTHAPTCTRTKTKYTAGCLKNVALVCMRRKPG